MPFWFVVLILCIIITIPLLVVVKKQQKKLEKLRAEKPEDLTQEVGSTDRFGRYDSRTLTGVEVILRKENELQPLKIGAVVMMSLTFLVFLFTIFTMVGTKQVGVVTEFGRPVGNLNNGLHMKYPWQKVKELDGAIQTDNHFGKNATKIRLGNQSTADVDNTVRWRIKRDKADQLFRDYRDFGNIRDSLVTRELKAAQNEVFKDYDPLSTVKGSTEKQLTLSEFGVAVTKKLKERIGDQIEVLNVIIPLVNFDPETQGRINAFQSEIANTRIAKQKQQTATAEAETNRRLANSVSKDPNVLVSKCLDTLADIAKKDAALPAGFSCWPGGSGVAVAVK